MALTKNDLKAIRGLIQEENSFQSDMLREEISQANQEQTNQLRNEIKEGNEEQTKQLRREMRELVHDENKLLEERIELKIEAAANRLSKEIAETLDRTVLE